MEFSFTKRAAAVTSTIYLALLAAGLASVWQSQKSTPKVRVPNSPVSTTVPADKLEGDGYTYSRRTVQYKNCRKGKDTNPTGLTLDRRRVPVESCPSAAGAADSSTIVVYESGDQRFYRMISREPVRKENLFRIVLQNELTDPSRIDSLKRLLQSEIGPTIKRAGFDSIRVGLEADRSKVARQLEQESIHLTVVPSSVVSSVTEPYPSVLDWEYKLLSSHRTYRSTVFFQSDASIRDLEDLGTLTVAAPHERSSSGYRVPMAYLSERGIRPNVRFLDGSHPDVWNAVLRGHVDAGFTYATFDDGLSSEKASRVEEIEIPIRIPGSVWVLRQDLTKFSGLVPSIRRAVKSFLQKREDPYWRNVSRITSQALAEYDAYRRIMSQESW